MLQIVIIAALFVALSPLVYYLLSLYCVLGTSAGAMPRHKKHLSCPGQHHKTSARLGS